MNAKIAQNSSNKGIFLLNLRIIYIKGAKIKINNEYLKEENLN